MTKSKTLAVLAAVTMVGSSAFAGDKACCATTANHDMKGACVATFAKLDLTAEQKEKMTALAAECDKTGCTKESMATMEKDARRILSKNQFTAWKAACEGKMAEKTQS